MCLPPAARTGSGYGQQALSLEVAARSARARLRLPGASASLGQSAARAALAVHAGHAFDIAPRSGLTRKQTFRQKSAESGRSMMLIVGTGTRARARESTSAWQELESRSTWQTYERMARARCWRELTG